MDFIVSYMPYVLIALILGFTVHVILSRRKSGSKSSGKRNGKAPKPKTDESRSWFGWVRWPYITVRGAVATFAYAMVFLLIAVIFEEFFLDRDYQPEVVTLPIGFENHLEHTLRDGNTSGIYHTPRASGSRWWQPCATYLTGEHLPEDMIILVNPRRENGRMVADGFQIQNDSGGTLQYRVWRVMNNPHGPTQCSQQ